MSSYKLKAKSKKTGKLFNFIALDDYFGKHNYGYALAKNSTSFSIDKSSKVYDRLEFDLEFDAVRKNEVEIETSNRPFETVGEAVEADVLKRFNDIILTEIGDALVSKENTDRLEKVYHKLNKKK